MRDLNYVVEQQASLTIAADARLGPINTMDDQVWAIVLGNSEPPAVSLQTTFGLRARSCRIFPRFTYDNHTINNPKEFYHPVTIHQYYPNYVKLSFKPFQCFNVILEYWVPDSQSISCRTRIVNTSREKRQIMLEWAELLIPTDDGHRMSADEIGLITILNGRTADLSPVFFLTGGAQPGQSPYPALELSYTILPHQEQELIWAHATYTDNNSSFEHAKKITSRKWDVEVARILRINSQRIEIKTGNTDWDNAFYLSQTLADQIVLNEKIDGDTTLRINTRRVDQSYRHLDGVEIKSVGDGQAVRKAFYLMNYLLPAAPSYLKALVEKLLSEQLPSVGSGEDSPLFIQLPPLTTPLLSALVWEYYRYSGDVEYLSVVFPKLLTIFNFWFTPAHDRDNDLFPEWDQPAQTGFEENPSFSYLSDTSPGLDISTFESPDLASYLYSECNILLSIARELNYIEPVEKLESIATEIKHFVNQLWDDQEACYLYQDRDIHLPATLQLLGSRSGSGSIDVHNEFQKPVRPHVRVKSRAEGTKAIQIYIQGISENGSHRVDHIEPSQFHWHLNKGYTTSRFVYNKIEQVEVTGASQDDEIILSISGVSGVDVTQLLPLWAGIPSEEQAKVLINLCILNKKRFLSPYGIRSYLDPTPESEMPGELSAIRPEWVELIVRGLLRYGERHKAAEVFTRLVKAVTHSISLGMVFHQYYQEETGKGLGSENTLFSLLPIGLFLDILGIKIFTPAKLEICAGNPFPWPVTIKYRGLTIVHQEKKSMVVFSDGQTMTLENNSPVQIDQDRINSS